MHVGMHEPHGSNYGNFEPKGAEDTVKAAGDVQFTQAGAPGCSRLCSCTFTLPLPAVTLPLPLAAATCWETYQRQASLLPPHATAPALASTCMGSAP